MYCGLNPLYVDMEKDKELVRIYRTATGTSLVDVTGLSPEDKARCREITRSIKDLESLTSFGSDIANARNEATHQLMEISKIDKAGTVGNLVKDVVDAIRDTEYKNPESLKGLKGFIARYIPFGTSIVKKGDQYILDRFKSASGVVGEVVKGLKQQQLDLKVDVNTLEHMLQKTEAYVDQLGTHYVALSQYYQDQVDELESMKSDNETTPGTWSDYQVAEKRAFLEEIEQRGFDIFLSGQYNSKVLIPSLMKMKDNAIQLSRNADQIIKVTIPNWEMSISMALVNQRAQAMASVQKIIKDKNNELMVANARMMKDVTITLEKETRRGVIDVEAYKEAYTTVTEALIESQKALTEARSKREQDMQEIVKINNEMAEKFKEIGEEVKKFYLDGSKIQVAKALQ